MITRRALLAGVPSAAATAVVQPTRAITRLDDVARPLGSCALIGDSLSTGYVPGLVKELVARGLGPFRLNIRGSRRINKVRRPWDAGREIVERLRADGFDPDVWVIALGGNDFGDFRMGRLDPATEIATMLEQLGPSAWVGWPTIYHRNGAAVSLQFNRALGEVTRDHPNLVLDTAWAVKCERNKRTWFRADGVHFKGKAVKARNAMLADLAARAAIARLGADPAAQG